MEPAAAAVTPNEAWVMGPLGVGCGFVFVGGAVGGTVTLLDLDLHPGNSDETARGQQPPE
jgi:hypothetical protein